MKKKRKTRTLKSTDLERANGTVPKYSYYCSLEHNCEATFKIENLIMYLFGQFYLIGYSTQSSKFNANNPFTFEMFQLSIV